VDQSSVLPFSEIWRTGPGPGPPKKGVQDQTRLDLKTLATVMAVEIEGPRYEHRIQQTYDHGDHHKHCSECSDLKEQLGDVTQRLEVQEVQVNTLRQLMESLRSSTLTVPPVPSPPGAMQTSTPVESPPSIFHAL